MFDGMPLPHGCRSREKDSPSDGDWSHVSSFLSAVTDNVRSPLSRHPPSSLSQKPAAEMGRPFLQHMGGAYVYSCERCDTFLTNKKELVSTQFTGTTGAAFLFRKVVNLVHSEVHDRLMITGQHYVRDVSCKKCGRKLGWMYEFAKQHSQRYKEGKTILEKALIKETTTTDPELLDHHHHHGSQSSSGSSDSIGHSHLHLHLHHHHHHLHAFLHDQHI